MSAFNQEKTLVGALSMIAKLQILFVTVAGDLSPPGCWWRGRDRSWSPGPAAEEVMGYTAHNLTQGDIINLGASGGCRVELLMGLRKIIRSPC